MRAVASGLAQDLQHQSLRGRGSVPTRVGCPQGYPGGRKLKRSWEEIVAIREAGRRACGVLPSHIDARNPAAATTADLSC
jgi:hypothetical protein